ncbi:MAG: MBL fold metallo-hydrolase [Clostridia bacterium]|jgi:glyoxylase-like metal-dependent hydrolase (beta-lactamase superfamily II)
MQIIKLTSSLLSSNCYIVISQNEALVIDPSVQPEIILSKIEEFSASLNKIIYTHAHIDHIFFGDNLKKATGAKTYGHKNDKDLYSDEYKNGSVLFGMNRKFDIYDIELTDYSTIYFGFDKIDIIHTPGHTEGSICIYTQNTLFTGDTLFYESVGRTDLGTGSNDMLYYSIKNKIYILPDETIILPGHGVKSTIKHEKENNPYVY